MSSELITFCREQFPRLVGLLSLYCGDRAIAEEVAQETLARICRDWEQVQRMNHPQAWASKTAINLANSVFRRRAAERRAKERMSAQPQTAPSAAEPATAIAIRKAIAALPKRHKTALVLHYYLDLPLVEVAKTMGVPEGTAKSWCRRGIQRLRKDLDFEPLEEAAHA